MNKTLPILFISTLLLAACGADSGVPGVELGEVESITLSSAIEPGTVKYQFEKAEEIEVFFTAFEQATLHTGPTTAEGPNFHVLVSYEESEDQEYLLWLRPDGSSGRFQEKPSREEGVYVLTEEDARKLADLLENE